MATYDAIVVGGGPGGAVCARHLGAAGLLVGLVDRAAPPRYKTCGGGVVGRALGHLGVDLGGVVERYCFRAEMGLVDGKLPGGGLEVGVERPDPVVYMTMRSALDERLVEAAVAEGVELLAPCSVKGLANRGGSVSVETDGGVFEAAFVVGADGADGAVANGAGFGRPSGLVPALESEIWVGRDDFERLSRAARFDFGLVDDGYCWVFPKREHLSVGCLATGRGGGRLKKVLEEYLARLGLETPKSREDHGFVIPVRPRAGSLGRNGVLLVGDAAGLADPVTCEGISNAALSGRLAAWAIASSSGDFDRASRSYREALDRELLPELRRGRLLARLLYRHPRLRRLAFRHLGQALAEGVTGVIGGEISYRELTGRPIDWLRGLAAIAGGALGRE